MEAQWQSFLLYDVSDLWVFLFSVSPWSRGVYSSSAELWMKQRSTWHLNFPGVFPFSLSYSFSFRIPDCSSLSSLTYSLTQMDLSISLARSVPCALSCSSVCRTEDILFIYLLNVKSNTTPHQMYFNLLDIFPLHGFSSILLPHVKPYTSKATDQTLWRWRPHLFIFGL